MKINSSITSENCIKSRIYRGFGRARKKCRGTLELTHRRLLLRSNENQVCIYTSAYSALPAGLSRERIHVRKLLHEYSLASSFWLNCFQPISHLLPQRLGDSDSRFSFRASIRKEGKARLLLLLSPGAKNHLRFEWKIKKSRENKKKLQDAQDKRERLNNFTISMHIAGKQLQL